MVSQPSLLRLLSSITRIILLVLMTLSTTVHSFSRSATAASSSLFSDNNGPPSDCEAADVAAISTVTRDWVAQQTTTPLTNTVLCLPPHYFADTVIYTQNIIRGSNQLKGYTTLQSVCRQWDETYIADPGGNVRMTQCRATMTSPTTMVTTWNVTWIPPTAVWLQGLAAWNTWEAVYVPYVHTSDQISTFSYKAVGLLLWDALKTQRLRIPLACIQGSTDYKFDHRSTSSSQSPSSSSSSSSSDNNNNHHQIVVISIQEDLAYAQELTRGVLQNRKCAQDLRLFLENGRRIPIRSDNKQEQEEGEDHWRVVVAQALPWQNVPGMNPYDVDPNRSDEAWIPAVFLGGVALTLVSFAAMVAPELLGQSFWGPPTYIVPPSELNIIVY